jgi:Rha family phage regulatory protein
MSAMLPVNLPALCEQLHLRADGRVPLVNSRDVADEFEKRHDHVLRDIDLLIQPKDLPKTGGISWFRETPFTDSYDREQRSFDMTRDGFMFLVMGWTGPKARQIKIRYIQAFNMMEELLNARPDITTHEEFIAAIREIVRPLAIRFDDQDRSMIRMEDKVDGLGEEVVDLKDNVIHLRNDVAEINRHLRSRVRRAAKKYEPLLVYVVWRFYGGKSPVSGVQILDDNGQRIRGRSQIEHFYTVDNPHLTNFWLVDKDINEGLLSGQIPRHSIEAHFRAFQDNLRIAQGGKIIQFPKLPKLPEPTLF